MNDVCGYLFEHLCRNLINAVSLCIYDYIVTHYSLQFCFVINTYIHTRASEVTKCKIVLTKIVLMVSDI